MPSFADRVCLLVRTPGHVMRWLKVWRAWERNDWQRMIELLNVMVGSGLDSNGERILLGVALSRQGHLNEALQHFDCVKRHDLIAAEEPIFFNEYASALYRAGKAAEGADLLRGAPIHRFPEQQRFWATEFVKCFGNVAPPPLKGLKPPRVLH